MLRQKPDQVVILFTSRDPELRHLQPLLDGLSHVTAEFGCADGRWRRILRRGRPGAVPGRP